MKKGLPMAAVTVPSGSSAGATSVRLIRSAHSKSSAPSTADAGSGRTWGECKG